MIQRHRRRLAQGMRIILHVMSHPIFIFVSFQCVWITLTLFWVVWFTPGLEGIREIFQTDTLALTDQSGIIIEKPRDTILKLIMGLVMLGTLLFGAIWLFWFGQNRASYYRQQQIFISSVTHELRAPITTLNLILSNLKNTQFSPKKSENLLNIGEQELTRLMHLINNILLTARLDRGIDMLDEKKQKITVKSLLEIAVERNKALDQDLMSRVHIKCLAGISINAPKTALLTLFSNLIENAIKYSPEKSPISISAAYYAGEYVDVTFTDEGYGIEEEDLRKIFKMFYRGDISKKQAIAGTGVGLFIVRTITKLLRGKVWAESQGRGNGAKLIVRLPIN